MERPAFLAQFADGSQKRIDLSQFGPDIEQKSNEEIRALIIEKYSGKQRPKRPKNATKPTIIPTTKNLQQPIGTWDSNDPENINTKASLNAQITSNCAILNPGPKNASKLTVLVNTKNSYQLLENLHSNEQENIDVDASYKAQINSNNAAPNLGLPEPKNAIKMAASVNTTKPQPLTLIESSQRGEINQKPSFEAIDIPSNNTVINLRPLAPKNAAKIALRKATRNKNIPIPEQWRMEMEIKMGAMKEIHKKGLKQQAEALEEMRSIGFQWRSEMLEERQSMEDSWKKERAALVEEIKSLKHRILLLDPPIAFSNSSTSTPSCTPSRPPPSHKIIPAIPKASDMARTFAQAVAATETQDSNLWIKITSKAQKTSLKTQEPGSRRMLFQRDSKSAPIKTEEDIFLAINEILKKSNLPTYIRAERVSYSASGSISVLLKEKAHTGLLFPTFKDALIKAVKAVDPAVIGVESIEHWQGSSPPLLFFSMPFLRLTKSSKERARKRQYYA